MRGPGWEHTKEEIVETLGEAGVPAQDIEEAWAKYQRLRDLVKEGKMPDREAKSAFCDLATRLVVKRFINRILGLPAFKELDRGEKN